MSDSSSVEVPLSVVDLIAGAVERIEAVSKECREILTNLKNLKREYVKEQKMQNKSKKKAPRKESDEPRKPSGFGLPTTISEELSVFLNITVGEKVPRTRVTSLITQYIKEHELQNAENRKLIDLEKTEGAALKKLLKPEKYLTDDKPLTFFNLQTLLKWHFPESKTVKDALAKEASMTVAEPEAAVPKKRRARRAAVSNLTEE